MNEELESQEVDAVNDTDIVDVNDADSTNAANTYDADSQEDQTSSSNDAVTENAVTEVEAEVEVDAVAELPAPKQKKKPRATTNVVVTPGANADVVHLSKCIYKNKYARKSLTIHHLQRRLNELGYKEAYSDKDGWFGDLTRRSVAEFQKDNNLEGDGNIDAKTFEAIFAGDPNVIVDVVS
jgi:hypothetical protein